jgi:beta-glucosidase
VKKNESIIVTTTATNTGKYDGEEVVQLYIRDVVGSITRPIKELKGFKKIMLKAGESKKVEFVLTDKELGFYTSEGKYVVESGDFLVMLGTNSQKVSVAKFTKE